MKRSTAALLVSGGLDSAVLVATLLRRHARVVPIYIRQGLRWEAAEQYWLRRWLRYWPARSVAPLVTLALPMVDLYWRHWSVTGRRVPRAADPDPSVYLPGRNVLLVAKAAVYCALHRIPVIAVGTLEGNPFTDASPVFRRTLSRTLTVGLGSRLTVVAPLATCSKAEVIRRGRALPLAQTFSCINPHGRSHCGRCQKCAERRRGFRAAGVPDLTRYVS